MKLIIANAEKAQQWIELFKVIKHLNSYTTICSRKDEVFIQIMDDSQVCLMNVTIESPWFDTYECDPVEGSGETFSFLSNIMVKILQLYSPGTTLCMYTKNEKLTIQFQYKDKSEKLFELHLVDVEKDVLDSQNIEGSVEFEINTKVFDKYVSEMILFGENMEFVCYQENIYMKSYGDEGMYTLKLPHDSMEELIVEDDLKLKTKVSLKYLSYITKIHPVFNTITMKVRPDAPIQVDILDEYIEVRYYIAPKISDHDEEEDEGDFHEYDQNTESDFEHLENEVIS